jgi:apolipoprotein N-acyltransferase
MKVVVRKDGNLKEKSLLLILAAAGVGLLSSAFGEHWIGLTGLLSLVPLLWLETNTRRSGFLTVFVFYLVFSRGILPGAAVFFRDGSLIRSFVLWVSSTFALALPWGLLWSDSNRKKALRIVFALLSSIPPPLGFIGWGNPLTAAGLFFPGFGWFGLVAMLVLYSGATLYLKLRRALIVLVLFAAPCLSLPVIDERVTIGGVVIQGLNTSFGQLASGSGDFEAQYERERMVFQYLRELERGGELEGADIVILPETIIGRMNPTTVKRWRKFFETFTNKGMIFLAGGEIPTDRGRKYDNAMISFEREGKSQTALQRFPVLLSMYRPLSDEGANAYLSSMGELSVMEIRGKRLGFLVCYEQFLTWPFLSLMSQKPDVIVAPANLWWCRGTSLPAIQGAGIRLWTRLFSVPVVSSANR